MRTYVIDASGVRARPGHGNATTPLRAAPPHPAIGRRAAGGRAQAEDTRPRALALVPLLPLPGAPAQRLLCQRCHTSVF